MDKAEILKKVEQRKYEKHCVNFRICPKCGQDLVFAHDILDDDSDPANRACKACNICWDHVQSGF